jgi:hypothetical protein
VTKFTDNLWSDLMREQGPTLINADRPAPSRLSRLHPRALAGSTLGLAGIGAALVIALGGSTAAPAFAVTTTANGVQVELNYVSGQNINQAEAKLASMGIHEVVSVQMARGAATTGGAVSCTQESGANTPVQVLVGSDGTETIGAGQSGGNTAEGSFHAVSCTASSDTGAGNTGA